MLAAGQASEHAWPGLFATCMRHLWSCLAGHRGALRLGRNCGLRGRDFLGPPHACPGMSFHRPTHRPTLCRRRAHRRGEHSRARPGWILTTDFAQGANTTMLMLKRFMSWSIAIVCILAFGGLAHAAPGQPVPWQLGLQESATPVMDDIILFHTGLLIAITLISAFVLVLLVVVMVRFNAAKNPTPSRTTHNTLIEVAWTIVPVLILVAIAIPSFRILFDQLTVPPADLTVKATGKQWFWTYAYPDNGAFEFDSIMLQDKELKAGQPRLLAVDNELVVPVNKVVRVLTTGADVIHSFTVPSFGIKIDAIPGRINEKIG